MIRTEFHHSTISFQADFSFFFDTSPRRKCYIAPERFYDSGAASPPVDAQTLTPAMDIFSAGCVLAELFAEGEPLFDYSRLLAFRRGDYDPVSAIDALDDRGIASVIGHMTQRDPSLRLTATEYIDMFSSVVMLDHNRVVVQVVHPFIAAATVEMEADARAANVAAGYFEIRDEIEYRQNVVISPLHLVPQPPPPPPPPPHPRDAVSKEEAIAINFNADQMHAHAAALLMEARAAVSTVLTSNRSVDAEDVPLEISQPTLVGVATSTVAATHHSPSFLEFTGVNKNGNDSLVVILSLLCAVLRGSRRQSIRVQLVEQIHDCAVRCGDDEARLQRAVPQLVAAATDPQFAVVRQAALRALPRVLACISHIPPGDVRAFTDYLFPSLSLLPADIEPLVQVAYAGSLAAIALGAQATIDGAGNVGVVKREEELGRLRGAVERAVHDLLVGSHPEPKLALLPHLENLSKVLGRRDTADGLLPALLTLFNSREWEVRAALYAQLYGVCPALKPQGVAFLLPFLDRMLSDPEPAAVTAAAALLTHLCRQHLLRQRHILAAVGKVIESGLLCAECTAVRAAAVEFMAAAAVTLPQAVGYALLLPLLRPHLKHDPAQLTSSCEIAVAMAKRSVKSETKRRPLNASLPPAATPLPPSTSYSVMLNRHPCRQGASWLAVALEQVANEVGAEGARGGVPLLVATAQRNVARPAAAEIRIGEPSALFKDKTIMPNKDAVARSSPATAPVAAAPVAAPWRPRGVLVAHLAEHKRQITRLASVPGTSLFLSASEDGSVKTWDARRLERDISFRPRASYEGHGASVGVRAVTALDDHATVISGGSDGSVHAWRIERGAQGEGWMVASRGDGHKLTASTCAGPVMDLCAWGTDMTVVSRAGTGVVSLDLRAPAEDVAWRLPYLPSSGVVTRLCCPSSQNSSPPLTNWIITGTSRGMMALWDVRFLLPVTSWAHPKGAAVNAMVLEDTAAPSSSSSVAPVVYVAAGKDEVAAWDAETGTVLRVLRVAGRDAPDLSLPEALATAAPTLCSAGDPLVRARQLGATDLRTLIPHSSGFRTFLSGPGSQLLTGSSDCAVRFWDVVNPQQSYAVVVPPPPLPSTHGAFSFPKWKYTMRTWGRVPVIEERPVEIAVQEVGWEDAAAVEQRHQTARWWDGAAALCHQQSIVDMTKVVGHAEPLLATGSLDGIIKIWR